MADELTVSGAELRRALDRVLGTVEERHGDVMTLSADYYWVLPPEVAYDLAVPDTSRLTMGQLSDDVDELAGMADAEHVEPWHDLAHLVGILQRIAAQDLPGPGFMSFR